STAARRRTFSAVGIAAIGVVSLLLACVTGVLISAPAPAGASSTVTVPQVPAQQPPLTMSCAAGQVDLNHASLAQLQTLPGVSGPIAQRIVTARPHDRVQDLLVVPGIGSDTLSAIRGTGRACS